MSDHIGASSTGRGPLRRDLAAFGTSVFGEMTALANEHGAVNLSQGFPDFDGPDFVREAAVRAIREGPNQYARSMGLPELVRSVAAKVERQYGLVRDPMREVAVFCGATEGFDDDVEFARHLTREVGVACIPPSVFYAKDKAEGCRLARFAFCKTRPTLEEAARTSLSVFRLVDGREVYRRYPERGALRDVCFAGPRHLALEEEQPRPRMRVLRIPDSAR